MQYTISIGKFLTCIFSSPSYANTTYFTSTKYFSSTSSTFQLFFNIWILWIRQHLIPKFVIIKTFSNRFMLVKCKCCLTMAHLEVTTQRSISDVMFQWIKLMDRFGNLRIISICISTILASIIYCLFSI